jgi:hypothetical protein
VAVSWNVTGATRIVIRENGTAIEERDLAECGGDDADLFTYFIQRPSVYRLEAYGAGGETVFSPEISLPDEDSAAIPFLRTLRLTNDSQRTLVIWKIQGWYADAADIPQDQNNKTTLAADAETTLSFDNCEHYQVVAIDKQMAESEGHNPEGDAIEISHLRRWETVLVGWADGEAGEQVIF